jgi:RND family efflux transporter MFP subunit
MKRAHLLPALAILGSCLAIAAIIYDSRTESEKTQGIPLFQPPFDTYVAGVGIIEAPSGNIAVGTPVSGVVTEIYVKVGDHVKVGDPLFKIDDGDLQAQLITGRARVKEAEAALRMPQHRFEYTEKLSKHDSLALSAEDLTDRQDEAAQAEAALALARAQLEQLQMEVERHTVHALVAGEILQLKMRPGEFVEGSSSAASPLLVLGSDDRMNVRIDIDAHDAWRVRPGADGVAFIRGNPAIKIPLRYEYTEPYVVPKTALTGQSTERTDTRVLQVLYSFERAALPVYTGELLDVYIQAPTSSDSDAEP